MKMETQEEAFRIHVLIGEATAPARMSQELLAEMLQEDIEQLKLEMNEEGGE
jgi:hypothetical protein